MAYGEGNHNPRTHWNEIAVYAVVLLHRAGRPDEWIVVNMLWGRQLWIRLSASTRRSDFQAGFPGDRHFPNLAFNCFLFEDLGIFACLEKIRFERTMWSEVNANFAEQP